MLSAAAAIGVLTFNSQGDQFHYDFPQARAEAIIVDETRSPLSNASAELTTSYWYPSLLGLGPRGKTFVETLTADAEGRIVLPLRRHPQVTSRKVVIRLGSIDKFSTTIDEDSTWLKAPVKPRIISVCTQQTTPPVHRVNWNGGRGHLKAHEVKWRGQPLYYSLKSGSFEPSPADITFHIERPSADAPDKLNQPLLLRVQYTAGKVQWISGREYWFSFPGTLATWGDVEEIRLEARNSRHWPAFSQAFAFSSPDGKVRGIMSFICHPVAERENDSTGKVDINIAARAEFY